MKKIFFVYIAISVLCVIIAQVYALFGHGLRSAYMDYMFLYPLVGGAIVFLFPRGKKNSRLGYNLYNSGLAALTAGALLRGIVEIAGTGSPWIACFTAVGGLLTAAGTALCLLRKGLHYGTD
jgi:hypothetical protein